ncbi:ABC transporter ATP-binding protein [bacterium RCC_150]
MRTDDPLVSVKGASRHYADGTHNRKIALNGIDLEIFQNELVAVVGPSGSGKSTLLQLLGGIDSPTRGDIEVAGHRISAMDEKKRTLFRRSHVGFIFQAFHLVPSMTVAENVGLSAIVSDKKAACWKADALILLDQLGLYEYADKFPEQLSGGQRQRVAVGRAMFSKPSLILADEPTGSLDSKNRDVVLGLIRAAIDDGIRTGGLMVTHDLHAAGYADRIVALSDGTIVGQLDQTAAGREHDSERGATHREERVRSWFASVPL